MNTTFKPVMKILLFCDLKATFQDDMALQTKQFLSQTNALMLSVLVTSIHIKVL